MSKSDTTNELIILGIDLEINLPRPPNFLRTLSDEPVPVQKFSDVQLEEIGRAWTRQLLAHARARR